MKRLAFVALTLLVACGVSLAAAKAPKPDAAGFYPLFNGRDLTGWKASENKDCFSVKNGCIVANGKRSHLLWPGKGYECQVNATHSDRKKTGGLYGCKDVMDTAPHKDKEWFTYYIKVQGKKVTIKINGKVTCEYTEPAGASGGRKISSGTIALQGHDPGSTVLYKGVKIKPLAD